MRIKMITALMANAAVRAFMSEVCQTVNIKGEDGKPLRVNKFDYDSDQASGNPTMELHKDQGEPITDGEVKTFEDLGMAPVAAPSAPNFGGAGAPPANIDPRKDAVAPAAPSPNQRLVSKEGSGKNVKYFIVDGTGTKLEGPGIDSVGYADEQAAWAAVMALPDAGDTGVNPAT